MQLNEKQILARDTIDWPLLIIAWAWSWKTSTLTSRVEYMIKEKNINPTNILCVTFTNKAAREMRDRIWKKLWVEIQNNIYKQRNTLPLIWTFHSIWVFFLKECLEKFDLSWLNLKKDFLIYGEDDKLRLIKDIITNDLKLDEKQTPARQIAFFISDAKNNLLDAKKYTNYADSFIKEKVSQVYAIYEKKMIENNALDFDDILFKTLQLLKNDVVLDYYQEKYKYIMVDEYQDTNIAQYEIIKLLASKYRNLAVVWDDWQSIYSWRWADMRNILNFKKDYPEALVVKLEQNYRSTKNIIQAANLVVKNNKTSLEKTLWTENETWEKIHIIDAIDDNIEAKTIAEIIKEKTKKDENNLQVNNKYGDNLILYRTNWQSRQIEEALINQGIPYKVVWWLKFYDRKEVKDLVWYLRSIYNQNDVISYKRIINTPSRKIWSRTLEVLDIYKENFALSYLQILENADEISDLGTAAKKSIKEFFNLMLNLIENAKRLEVADLLDYIIKKIDYENYLINEYWQEEKEWRMDNLKELKNLASNYNWLWAKESLSQFLEEVALISDLDNVENNLDYVTLMTIHTSKWLEQKRVFIAWVEESIFPHIRSLESPKELEEERRLMYVAMTRAKKELYISRAEERFYFWKYVKNLESRFLKEIPEEFTEIYKSEISNFWFNSDFKTSYETWTFIQKIKPKEYNDISIFSIWDRVSHHKFWEWIITSISWEIASIAFSWNQIRKMNIKIAPIKKCCK